MMFIKTGGKHGFWTSKEKKEGNISPWSLFFSLNETTNWKFSGI